MNVLFLTLIDFDSIEEHGIYQDLLREFYNNGHTVYAISPIEKRKNRKTELLKTEKATILKLRIGNTQKTNVIEKGISTLLIEPQFIGGIRKYFSNVKFDLVLYTTPPITLVNAIRYVKKRDNATTYLMLKDIFPQNAVDLEMMSKTGITAPLYWYFRLKEKRLYSISDKIGCMSQANVNYILKHNANIDLDKLEICPNAIEIQNLKISEDERDDIRKKYNLPIDKKIFVYGGNLGKPQGIQFVIDCLTASLDNPNVFFLIIGSGTEYFKLEQFVEKGNAFNVRLMRSMPKSDYDKVIASCDVGMIFLDHRFTIPNFPSRLLGYLSAGLPIIACTDVNTDIGQTVVDGNLGWWCESNDVSEFMNIVDEISSLKSLGYGGNAYKFLCENYDVKNVYESIFDKIM